MWVFVMWKLYANTKHSHQSGILVAIAYRPTRQSVKFICGDVGIATAIMD